jgi:alanine dehydrogenase
MEVLVLSKSDIEPLVNMKEAISDAETAYKLYAQSQRKMIPSAFSPVVNLQFEKYHGELDFRSGFVEGIDYICTTFGCGYAENPTKYDLPAISGLCALNDVKTGQIKAVMEVAFLSSFRTGAAGAVAAKELARENSRDVAIIGTGSQGRFQLMGLNEVYSINEVRAFSPNKDHRETFAKEMNEKLNLNVKAVGSAQQAVQGADIVVTGTRSTEPVVFNNWIRKGVHINAVGADAPGKQELDFEVLKRADKIVVDSLTQCSKIGEIHKAINLSLIKEEDVYAEIGEILMGWKKGRESEDEITIFDTTGLAVQDNVIFSRIYDLARKKIVGTNIQFA